MREKTNLLGYFYISPYIIGLLAFTLIPMAISLYLSFTDYNLLSSPRWIGGGNFSRMVSDDQFWQSVRVTFYYVFTAVPARLVFALAVAIALKELNFLKGFYRLVFYVPSLIGGSVAVAVIWVQLFSKDGVVNAFLNTLGFNIDFSWIGNPSTAIWTLVLLSAWQFGSAMLIFLAGLQNIPKDYYEAASVDGANAWRRFVRITLPMLSPIILFNVVMQTINGFLAFTPSYIVTEGGPMNSTLLYVLYLFRRAFQFSDMGYASAMAWVMLILISILTALIFSSSRSLVHYEGKGD
ncbi:carbohydrate ABC transporter permease [Cohnella thailandensis]|uniref:Sugar ABC transporter permease n=1 Tax=Cohnella thailandensis TaxID=557557 RepID=A0A841SQJ1_9BACL|nr:sugar ABC transporter permease [Cohnella thailandensis]MBB6633462.1 sugar ABC transporter permease [Cohnella thailandensis]MBP1974477.1 multiple sugar transport system permease protein [Cohnella thailandensis]